MKRIIVIICIMLLTYAAASPVGIGGGAKGGLNATWLHGNDVEDVQTKIGFCVGGFATCTFFNTIAIQPEVFYSQEGARWTGHNPYFGPLEATVKLEYLTFPIILKYIMPAPGVTNPVLFAGPYFAKKLSAKAKLAAGGVFAEEDIEYIKDTDFGLVLGVGVDFGLQEGNKVVLDVRYSLGLSTIDEEGFDVKNDVISILVGYSL